jgi:hypothetical protein
MSVAAAWRIVAILSVISAGAYIGNESAHYFWDLTSYVEALDSEFPYRAQRTYPFLYPPFTADLFTLARSHLFELLSIAYVGAGVFFLHAAAQLNVPRKFEWLLAITAMGGLGIVSLQSGNLAILMNLGVLGLACHAAMGNATARHLLPIAIGVGALMKPQFVIYLGLLQALEPRKTALIKIVTTGLVVAGVYAIYMWWRPFEWNEYVQAIVQRTAVEKDYAWGPAGFIKNFTDSDAAALAAYTGGFVAVWLLAYAGWRKSVQAGRDVPDLMFVCLAFVALTFMNPRLPLYDVHAAGLALAICCGLVAGRSPWMPWLLAVVLAINLVPWTIANFARDPSAYPGWMQNLQIVHFIGIGSLLVALARAGLHASPATTEPGSL